MRRLSYLFLISWLLVSPVFGQASHKEAHPAGNLVIVAPEKVEDSRQVWMLTHPETFEQFSIENGKLFLAMPKHEVRFRLLIVPNDVKQDIYFKTYNLTPGQVTEPDDPVDPDDPVEPDDPPPPTTGWTKWVTDNKSLLPNDNVIVQKLGDNFINVSKRDIADVLTLTVILRDMNHEVLGDNFLQLVPWSKKLQEEMLKANLADSISKTKQVCFEIGTALKEVAK